MLEKTERGSPKSVLVLLGLLPIITWVQVPHFFLGGGIINFYSNQEPLMISFHKLLGNNPMLSNNLLKICQILLFNVTDVEETLTM